MRVFEEAGQTPVIVMGELPQNTSTSVTNMAEYLAPELIQRHFPRRFEELPPAIFLEHYVEERTLGWLKGFRRLRYRVDRTAASFHAFVYLAVLVLCVRRLISPSRLVSRPRFRPETLRAGGSGRRPRSAVAQGW